MREYITDITKKIGGLGLVDTIKVTGTADETKIEAVDNDKTLIIKAKLTQAQPDLIGTFGISNLNTLGNLLNFASYKTDQATFSVKRRADGSCPEELEFRDVNGMGSNFRLMSGQLVAEQPVVAEIKWDVTFTPTKSKIAEFSQLASALSEFDQYFSVKTKDGSLVVAIGEEGSASHRGAMVLADEVDGELRGDLLWPINQFLSIMKLADGHDNTVSITSKGALQVKVTTGFAEYLYILPARRR